MNKIIKFKPLYSAEIELVLGDGFSFQCSGKDEDGNFVMHNNLAEVVEENGELKICYNGTRYNPYHFLYCDHLDGDISMDHIKKIYNWITGERYES